MPYGRRSAIGFRRSILCPCKKSADGGVPCCGIFDITNRCQSPTKSMSKSKPKLPLRDTRTLKRLNELADNVVSSAQRGRDPAVDIPTRALSNIRFNKSRKILEMG